MPPAEMKQHPISALPLWMENAAIAPPSAGELPGRVDVLIIGAGYTGLSAARETAAAGRSTLVLDAGALGTGCSSRNGGQVAYSIKPSFDTLKAKHGADVAFGICREGLDAVAYLRSLATQEIDCHWREDGCFFGAHTPRHFERMAREAENQPRGLEQRISVVSRAEQHGEIASDFYHGGCVYPDDASVDPTRLLLGLLRRALDCGASVVERCPVSALRAARDGFEALTPRGVVHARQVLLATNGYSGPLSPWHRRRVIPIGSYQIATEPLGADRVRALDSPRTKYRRFAARRRVFQAFGGRRAHRIRRPRGAGREGPARLRASSQADDGAHTAPIAFRAAESRVGGVGGVHFRYPAAPGPARGYLLLHGILRSGRAPCAVFRQANRAANAGTSGGPHRSRRSALPVAALLSRKAVVSRAVGVCLSLDRCTGTLT